MASMLCTEQVGRVLVATLSRPPVNALDDALVAALDAVVHRAAQDDDVVVLHLRSDQRSFSAGADLALVQSCFEAPEGAQAIADFVHRLQRLTERLESAPLITLAEIGGAALGGGLELALACDLRVAALDARIGLPEARLGLVPGAGGTQRLTRLCGPGVATRLILGAELVDGEQAQRLGLVQWARPGDELAAFAAGIAARHAEMPKAALAAAKRCISAATEPLRDGYAEELRETRRLYTRPDTRRRVSDFLARRAS
jgi:enoyl-CoA hydratase/carnithine racemase